MRLLTPAIEELFEVPSLAQAFLQACASRGVEPTAQDLSRLFCPTGTENPHADLMGLAEALLDTEQWLQQWRGVHLLMVDRMIGNQRASLGVGGQTADGRGDSKPYLLSTLDYSPIFPELWAARNYVQANRRTTGTASRPRAASGCSS
jgi:hypothetical protein